MWLKDWSRQGVFSIFLYDVLDWSRQGVFAIFLYDVLDWYRQGVFSIFLYDVLDWSRHMGNVLSWIRSQNMFLYIIRIVISQTWITPCFVSMFSCDVSDRFRQREVLCVINVPVSKWQITHGTCTCVYHQWCHGQV